VVAIKIVSAVEKFGLAGLGAKIVGKFGDEAAGVASASLGKVIFPNATQIAKQLGTKVDEFHINIKPQIVKDFSQDLKTIKSTNPDIGIDKLGNIVLRNPKTGAAISTKVPLSSYGN